MGAEIIFLPGTNESVDLPSLMQELRRRQINEIHVEVDANLNGSLIREACADEILLYVGPNLLDDARGLFDLPAPDTLDGKRTLSFHDIATIGPDLKIMARFS